MPLAFIVYNGLVQGFSKRKVHLR